MKKNIQKIIGNKMKEKGYALLFAVLVASVVLGVGVSILNIARKEILLTTGAAQSQYAFAAADAGYECAVYQDYQKSAFNSTSTSGTFSLSPSSCGAIFSGTTPSAYSPTVTITSSGGNVFNFNFNVPVSINGACASVSVQKTYTIVGTSTKVATSVLSDGFNVGLEGTTTTSADCNAYNQSKVERALLASY
jgi:hypothetical protein